MPQVTETINGLHSCKPGNEPKVGETKTFVVEHKPARNGKKPWIKIRSAGADYGGEPYRILSAEPTGFTDTHGNISFNIEIEPASVESDEHGIAEVEESGGGSTFVKRPAPRPQSPPPRQTLKVGNVSSSSDNNGVDVDSTRRHIMQAVNLYNLCVDAVDTCIKPHINNMDGELYQAAIGTLFIEASHKRTNDGIAWWSYVDKMPDTPIKKKPPHPDDWK